MPPPPVDMRQLASFALACQNPTIGETARELGVSVSTVSTGLHALERSLDLRLFQRKGSLLAPLPAAFWLFPLATAALHAEERLHAAVAAGDGMLSQGRIHVRLDLSFNIGRVARALSRSITAFQRAMPGAILDYSFASADPGAAADSAPDTAAPPPPPGETLIHVSYAPPAGEDAQPPLWDDEWVVVRPLDAAPSPAADERLVLLRLRAPLMASVEDHARRSGFADRIAHADSPAESMGELLGTGAGRALLVPRSLLSGRMGMGQFHATPLDPPLKTRVAARITGADPALATRFLDLLRTELAGPEAGGAANAVFRPGVTTRQVHYINLVRQMGGIAAAARAAQLSQPSVSQQIHRMEDALGTTLLERAPTGTRLSQAGARLAPLLADLEARLARIQRETRDVAARTQAAVSLGLLPSSGHDSEMTAKVAQALSEVRARFPGSRLQIVQMSNAALHGAIRSGALNLALVGSAMGQFPRVQLGPSERLSVVAHPSLGLAGRATIPLEQAVALPLVLGPRQLSIHGAFVAKAEQSKLQVTPEIIVESLPLAIAMARLSPLATVLPASSVRQDVEAGRLTASRLDPPFSTGTLSVIFSGERALSEIERAVVRALATTFAGGSAEPAR